MPAPLPPPPRRPRLLALVGSWLADDAVGIDLAGLLTALRAQGWDAGGWAEQVDPAHAHLVVDDLDARLADPGCAVLLVHVFHWPRGEALVARAAGPRVLRYHGGPDPRLYRAHPSPYADLIARYWRQSRRLAPAFDLALAPSTFVARRLWRWGAPRDRLRVVPPFLRLDALRAVAPDPDLAARLAGEDRPVVLTLGRVAVQKNQGILVGLACSWFLLDWKPAVVLRLVGRDEADGYAAQLAEELSGWQDRQVLPAVLQRWGPVGPAGLRAHLAAASVLLVTSRSEGFCVPIVEAQALGVPVVAGRVDAVPETAGEGALLAEVDGPGLCHDLVQVLTDGALRARLVAAGRANAERFDTARTSERLRTALAGLLDRPRAPRPPTASASRPLGRGASRAVRWLRRLRAPPSTFP